MSEQDFREIARNGLWRNNPGLVQLLGLCPLLGTSNSTVNALGLGQGVKRPLFRLGNVHVGRTCNHRCDNAAALREKACASHGEGR